jgi:hypothetical protein
MSTFRIAIPASVCVSFEADSEEAAIKAAKEWLIEVSEGLGVEYWGEDGNNTPDARVYFKDDEDDLSIEDEYDDDEDEEEESDSTSIFDEEPANAN